MKVVKIFFGVLAILNKFGVTLLTDLSVELAESKTAINKVKLLEWFKGGSTVG
jgi:hypothetical protein